MQMGPKKGLRHENEMTEYLMVTNTPILSLGEKQKREAADFYSTRLFDGVPIVVRGKLYIDIQYPSSIQR